MSVQVNRLVPPFGAIAIHRLISGIDGLARAHAARRAEHATRKLLEGLTASQLADIGIDRDLASRPDRRLTR